MGASLVLPRSRRHFVGASFQYMARTPPLNAPQHTQTYAEGDRQLFGQPGFQLEGGGGSIKPPKTGGGGVWEKGSIDRTITQSL